MLAGYPDPTAPPGGVGDEWFLYVGPAVIFLAVILWVAVTLTASRVRPRSRTPRGGLPDRGPVQGGIIAGSPSQRTRRDPAPSVTHREVMARIEHERARAEAAREQPAREQPARGRGRRRRRPPRPHRTSH